MSDRVLQRWRLLLGLCIIMGAYIISLYSLMYGSLHDQVFGRKLEKWLRMRKHLQTALSTPHDMEQLPSSFWCPLYQKLGLKLVVVVPFIEKDIPLILQNLALWNDQLYPLQSATVIVDKTEEDDGIGIGCNLHADLVFYFAQQANQSLQQLLVHAANEALMVHRSFKQIDVWSAALSDADNRRHAIADTTGPNNLFFTVMERLVKSGIYHYMWYMEPDVMAIRKFWLDKVMWEVIAQQPPGFWIKGTIHRKDNLEFSRNYIDHRFHFNGAALYNVHDPLFLDFLHSVAEYVRERPYDFGIDELLHDPSLWGDVQHIIHKFIYTDFVQNRHGDSITLQAILDLHPNTFFVHGLSHSDLQHLRLKSPTLDQLT